MRDVKSERGRGTRMKVERKGNKNSEADEVKVALESEECLFFFRVSLPRPGIARTSNAECSYQIAKKQKGKKIKNNL